MGEEEATMRERLVERMVAAIRAAPSRPGGYVEYKDIASTALDAALAMLETPSEEMLAAFWNAGDDCWGGTHAVVRQAMIAMLATLRSPKI
jgi:hypothetical protein